VCSGIEAASVAWHSLGWTPVGFSEIEPFPCAVLAHHFPKVTNYGDMSKFRDWSIRAGDIDLLVGGTPCQSFSVAGLRQGLNDPRGNLMLTFLAIAEHLKPKWILWENVPGVLSSNGGRDFASFLGALGQLGYGFAYRVLDAQWCRTHGHPRAVPQRRRRVFVIGCLGDQRSAAKVLFESESLQRYSAKSKATRQGTAADVEEGVGSGGDGGVPSSRGEHLVADVATVDARNNVDRGDSQHLDRLILCWWDGGNTASTLTSSLDDQRMPDKDNFGAVLQPVPFVKAKRAQSTTDNETWVEGVVAPTQNAFDVGDTRATTAILFENHPNDSRVTGPHDVAPSCVSRYGTGGGNVPLVIPIQDSRVIEKKQNGIGVGNETSPAYTIDQTGAQAVAIAIPIMPQAMQAEGWRVGKENQDGRGNGLGVGKDGDPCPTLDRSAVPAVAVGCFKSGQSAAARSLGFSETESPTLGASGGNGIPAVAIVNMQGSKSNACVSTDGSSYTINAMHGHDVHAVAFQQNTRDEVRLMNGDGQIAGALASESGMKQQNYLASTTMQVRRLTPTECERLQGFPDGWTAIPWKKKNAENCPDGPRYKALGNSMAVNCMEWIGQRINAIQTQS
jgi:site-specific DNA-cytosine methylase